MHNRFLLAAGTLAAIVPTLAVAQQRPPQRPAQPPPQQPAQRPAAQPAQRPAAMMATAHREGSWELSVGAAAMVMDKLIASDRAVPAATVRLGYNINEHLNISAGGAGGYGKPVGSALSTAFIQPFVGVTWTSDLNAETNWFLTGGVGGTLTKTPRLTSQYGVGGGAGIRHTVGENLAVRLEGRAEYEHYSETGLSSVYNGVASLGLSYFAGGGPPPDTDGDGVPDKLDRCPNTPHGAVVDARGCPVDSDRDGVPDGLDRCPGTPANTPVDANGCPRDSDRDGVPDNLDRCPNTPAGVHVDANGCPVDSDHDGVPDNLDRCPNTPAGTAVDANGCPLDSDHDGVPDSADRCPNTPAGVTVDANGCPLDTDHDGVPDNADRCPNTAPNTPVDANGCPIERDADHDGVPDSRDRCPNTPANARVDANGCPLAELPAAGATMVLRITFTPRNTLTPAAQTTLDGIATAIQATPNSRWEIGGYTASTGSVAVNRRTSQARAAAVRDYLVSKGIAASAITAVGYGPDHPVAPNTTAAGRAQNRRVEIKRVQ